MQLDLTNAYDVVPMTLEKGNEDWKSGIQPEPESLAEEFEDHYGPIGRRFYDKGELVRATIAGTNITDPLVLLLSLEERQEPLYISKDHLEIGLMHRNHAIIS
ncbi:hypothetical protein NLG97_g328 [Lecanicillium saksenae]|uniref:Uncharacterized protein n=1 Tax=Lecanicillium saksenae TaxID=468837 RepID=A0ACC1R6W8_9HYPO|nr:hypothetical protein NLG97_g328 [Lecanicillium saksenae]